MGSGWAGIELATPGSAVRHASVARHVTDCATLSGITLCKHVMTEENAKSVLGSFSYTKNHVIFFINIVITQIAISITSSLSGFGFYVMRGVKYGGW